MLPNCGHCGAKYGKFHKPGCEVEECPFCHDQLIGCDCCYILLNIDPDKEPVYSQGLNKKLEKQWNRLLCQKGRVRVGKEIRPKAVEIWTKEERNKYLAFISAEMADAAKSSQFVSARLVKRWSERINILINSSAVFLEMNRDCILRGKAAKWRPPNML